MMTVCPLRLLRFAMTAALGMTIFVGCSNPIGPFSGGRLSGEETAWPPDWAAVSNQAEAELETRPDDPYSVNIWFVVVADDAYLSSSLLYGTHEPEEREWVRNVDTDPRVRFRVGGIVYPARAEAIEDPDQKALVLDAFRVKYPQLERERENAARVFRLVDPGAPTS